MTSWRCALSGHRWRLTGLWAADCRRPACTEVRYKLLDCHCRAWWCKHWRQIPPLVAPVALAFAEGPRRKGPTVTPELHPPDAHSPVEHLWAPGAPPAAWVCVRHGQADCVRCTGPMRRALSPVNERTVTDQRPRAG